MDTEKFVLLDIDYVTRYGQPVIRLFGKIPVDNRSIIAHDRNFHPYLYLLPYDLEACREELVPFEVPGIERLRRIDKDGVVKEFLKLTLRHPRDLLPLKRQMENLKSVESVREYDIPLPQRYLIDRGLYPLHEVEVQGRVLKNSGATCLMEIQKNPRPVESGLPGLKILSFKIETHIHPRLRTDPILHIGLSSNQGYQKVLSTTKSSSSLVESLPTEKELLEKFAETIRSLNPDIITGYNSDKYDFPYLQGRADLLGVNLNLGVDGSPVKFRTLPKKSAAIKGRVHIDLYRVARRHLQLTDHTLRNVYQELYREEKMDISLDQLHTYQGHEKLLHYSLEDTQAIHKIGEKMLPLVMEIARLVGQSLFEVTRRGSSYQVECLLMRKAYQYGYVVPNKSGTYFRDVVGGHVEEPVPGLHKNIFYFDFRSLYPSIIVAKNISPDTLTESDVEECHVAPEYGYRFRKEPAGFIPRVTSQVLKERIRIKDKMKETSDPGKRQVLDFRQRVLKIFISTIYGLFNHSTYRWYSAEASEAITAWGRDYLKKTMEDAEKQGFRVLYADTDGFYATMN